MVHIRVVEKQGLNERCTVPAQEDVYRTCVADLVHASFMGINCEFPTSLSDYRFGVKISFTGRDRPEALKLRPFFIDRER